MNAAGLVATALGAGLLGSVVLDIYRTILHSRGRSGPVTEELELAGFALYPGYDWNEVTGDSDLRIAAE